MDAAGFLRAALRCATDSDHGKPGVFLDIRSKVRRKDNEEGLLSLAFHPRYPVNGFFYVYYSASNPRRGILSRFKVSADDPNRAEPDSEKVILEVDQPYGNHNGATVLFGPDGYFQMHSYWDGSAFNAASEGLMSTDLDTRKATFAELLAVWEDEAPAGYLYVLPMFYGQSTAFNWTASDTGLMDFRADNLTVN